MTTQDMQTDWAAAASLDDWQANFLHVGPVARDRNLNFLLAALAEYRKAYDSFARLILAGSTPEGDYLKELRESVHSLGLGGDVLVVNSENAGRRRALMAVADVVVVMEGDGIPVSDMPMVRAAGTPRKVADSLYAAMA